MFLTTTFLSPTSCWVNWLSPCLLRGALGLLLVGLYESILSSCWVTVESTLPLLRAQYHFWLFPHLPPKLSPLSSLSTAFLQIPTHSSPTTHFFSFFYLRENLGMHLAFFCFSFFFTEYCKIRDREWQFSVLFLSYLFQWFLLTG